MNGRDEGGRDAGDRDAGGRGSVLVIGAGTMGAGIALNFAKFGFGVTLAGRKLSSLEAAMARIAASLERLAAHRMAGPEVAKPMESPGTHEHVLARIHLTTTPEEAAPAAELVIETISERLEDKKHLLSRIEALLSSRAILTSNTSSLSLRALATGLRRPERFAGYHWFNPPELVPLVEVVPAPQTSGEVLQRLAKWSAGVGKLPVTLVRDVKGFVVNRLQYALLREAYKLIEDGVCSAEDVDLAVVNSLGPRWATIGPFEAMDLAGLDLHLAVARQLFPVLSDDKQAPAVLGELVAGGHLGAESGSGIRGAYSAERLAALRGRQGSLLLGLAHPEGSETDDQAGAASQPHSCADSPG
ncbi:MAG: 3-hydroxyacyl-CoA dehydrogenase family protein [Acidimicrobiales bacterium]